MPSIPLLERLEALEDPRQACKVVYPLPEIMLLALAGTLAGADDCVEITLWGREHLGFLRRFYPYARGIPSHDTLCDVFAALDPDLFRACFLAWIEDLRDDAPDVVAIDGKTTRGSRDGRKGCNPLHLVSAWATRQRLVLGQQACAEKSNEITAIPLLLRQFDLTGALVTIDAMGTQTDIAQAIRDGGGDYCLALKTNWPVVHAEVALLFDDPPADARFDTYEDTDKNGGGRIEVRRHSVCHKIDWLRSNRRYPGEPVFPDLAAIGRVEVDVERNGSTQRQVRYFLLSTALDAKTLACVVRGHWGVENRLHWVLDVVFREDLKRLRTGHAAQNMAIVRHAAVNLLNRAKATISLKNRRKRAGWNADYLRQLLSQTA